MTTWRQYGLFVRIGFKSQAVYMTDFLVGAFGTIALNAVDLAMLGILLRQFGTIAGWTIWEIVFLYSFFLAAFGLQNLFTAHVEKLDTYIQDGTFDQFLTRPVSPLVQLIGREIGHKYLVHLVMGIACLGLAYVRLGLHWSPAMWVYFGVLIVSGAAVLAGMTLGICSLAFWTVQSRLLLRGTLQVQEAVAHYPTRIFGPWFELLVTSILPFAFANYYPSLVLLGRADQAMQSVLGWCTPLAACLVVLGSVAIWRLGISRYQSTGS